MKMIKLFLISIPILLLSACDFSPFLCGINPSISSKCTPENNQKTKEYISINEFLKITLSTTKEEEKAKLTEDLKDKENFQYKVDDSTGFIYVLINEIMINDFLQLTFLLENQKYYLSSKQLADGVLVNTLQTQSNLYENNYIPVVIKTLDNTKERTFNMIITSENNLFTTFSARLIGYSKNIEGNKNVNNYISFLDTDIQSYIVEKENVSEEHTFFVAPAEYLYYLSNEKYGFDIKIFTRHKVYPPTVYKEFNNIRLGDTYEFEKKALTTSKKIKHTFDIKPNPTPLFINFSYGDDIYYFPFDFSKDTLYFPLNDQPDSMNLTFLGECEDLEIEFETSDFIGLETKDYTRSVIGIDDNNVCDVIIKKKGGATLIASFESELKVTRGNREYITKVKTKNSTVSKLEKVYYEKFFKDNILGKLIFDDGFYNASGYIYNYFELINPDTPQQTIKTTKQNFITYYTHYLHPAKYKKKKSRDSLFCYFQTRRVEYGVNVDFTLLNFLNINYFLLEKSKIDIKFSDNINPIINYYSNKNNISYVRAKTNEIESKNIGVDDYLKKRFSNRCDYASDRFISDENIPEINRIFVEKTFSPYINHVWYNYKLYITYNKNINFTIKEL